MAKSSLRETLTSVTIAFAYAFVFRAFVVEAFVIPTGSMAPTLLGQHERIRSEATGYEWTVGPWSYAPGQDQVPHAIQKDISVHDPLLGVELPERDERRLSGDRILVLKYLPPFFPASRYDVVVFKSPEQPQTNFIKRLLGLPGEQVALVDGDVFTRPNDGVAPDDGTWSRPGWTIQRKPERVQRAVWQPYYDSRYSALTSTPLREKTPWEFGAGWQVNPREEGRARALLRYDGVDPTTIRWKAQEWAIWDHYPYNETRNGDPVLGQRTARQDYRYPVSDLRVAMEVETPTGSLDAAMVLEARGHTFRAELARGEIVLSMAPAAPPGETPAWTVLHRGPIGRTLGPSASLEFWHADQSLQVWIDGVLRASADYGWGPGERIEHAIGRPMADILDENLISRGSEYRIPRLSVEFGGGPFTIHRLRVDRDLHYQAGVYGFNGRGLRHSRAGQLYSTAHPRTTLLLSPTQYFTCGDNSPASSDARQWDKPDPWVAATIDPTIGVVPSDLLIGKAFFVYFPSMHYEHWFSGDRAGLPDFGRMRWIW